MHLAMSDQIRAIDQYALTTLHIPTDTLVQRSGGAVARVVREHIPLGASVVVLAGKGNNGADGYAAASQLMDDYRVCVVDVFSLDPTSEQGSSVRTAYLTKGGHMLAMTQEALTCVAEADCLIDAIFGTGFHGQIPSVLDPLCDAFDASHAYKIAVDLPLGVDPDDGHVQPRAFHVDATVVLSFMKAGLVSYPGRAYVGALTLDTIGLPTEELSTQFPFRRAWIDEAFVAAHLPARRADANKATFGHVCLVTGSAAYRGAAHLSLAAALRGGVGYVHYFGEASLVDSLLPAYPEALYHTVAPTDALTQADIDGILRDSAQARAILVGCGSGCSEGLYRLIHAMLTTEGPTIILDADAINALCQYGEPRELASAARPVILTPHPKEFSRLCGHTVDDIQANRLSMAEAFAKARGVTLVLKGAGTIVTDGCHTYINSSGSTALSKAGSGDALAGCVTALCAQTEPSIAAALAVYLHGRAADAVSDELSPFGVTPSDLPCAIAREIRRILA